LGRNKEDLGGAEVAGRTLEISEEGKRTGRTIEPGESQRLRGEQEDMGGGSRAGRNEGDRLEVEEIRKCEMSGALKISPKKSRCRRIRRRPTAEEVV
jgi:hypothetical protein